MTKTDAEHLLLVVAAPKEATSLIEGLTGRAGASAPGLWERVSLTDRVDLVLSGIGKVNAAGASLVATDPGRHGTVLSVGIGGVLPGGCLALGACVDATESVYADEGILTPAGFAPTDDLGFPLAPFAPGGRMRASSGLLDRLGAGSDASVRVATVSCCSGTDGGARTVVSRTGASVEGMEGAAVVHAVRSRWPGGPSVGEVRVVSNTTGDRADQVWDLGVAFERLRVWGAWAGRVSGWG